MGFLLFGALPTGGIEAQASVAVSASQPVYEKLARLRGQGLSDGVMVGQRPWSRIEIARMVAEARERLDTLSQLGALVPARQAYLGRLLEELAVKYQPELIRLGLLDGESTRSAVQLLDRVDLEALVVESPFRPVPEGGIGRSDARINPLLHYREGRDYVNGTNLGLETFHRVQVGDWLAVQLHPRLELSRAREGSDKAEIDLHFQSIATIFTFGNVRLTVGRQRFLHGQGLQAGGLASLNPLGSDAVEISNDRPMRLPWILRGLGPARLSFSITRTDDDRDVPHSLIARYRFSAAPAPWAEVGVGALVQSGGEGAPEATLGERIVDHLLFPDLFNGTADLQSSNKAAGLDFRFRAAGLRGLELYGEAVFDDLQLSRLESMLYHNAQYVFGLALARLNESGTLAASVEIHHTGITLYRHRQFTSGLTADGFVLGNALGPDGEAVYARLDWDASRQHDLGVFGAVEQRSSDAWTFTRDPEFRYVKLEENPEESRYRAGVTWRMGNLSGPFAAELEAGYERVLNPGFRDQTTDDNWLGRVLLSWTPS